MGTLITTIGTGSLDKKKNEYTYGKTTYQFLKEKPFETSYIGSAILNCSLGKNIEKVIVFGTPSTGWANLLKGFELDDKPEYEDFWLELKTVEEDARQDKSIGVTKEQLSQLQSILCQNNGSIAFELKLIPLAYDTKQLWDFLSILTDTIMGLPNSDEIVIDITHGLRYHQAFMASTLGFINQLSLGESRNIRLVYGIFNPHDEISPIIELNMITEIHQWAEALNAFINHGDYEFLADKIKTLPQKSAAVLASTIEILSFEIAGNYVFVRSDGSTGTLNQTLSITKKQIERFEIEAKDEQDGEVKAAILVFSQLKNWISKFEGKNDPVELLFALAEDHLESHRYLAALTSCSEGQRQFEAAVAGIRIDGTRDTDNEIIKQFKVRLNQSAKGIKNDYYMYCLNSVEKNKNDYPHNTPISLRILRNQVVHCAADDQLGHVSARGFKNHVEKSVKKTISLINQLKKNGLK